MMAENENRRWNRGCNHSNASSPTFLRSQNFLAKGISVICEKPITKNLSEALELKQIVEKSNTL